MHSLLIIEDDPIVLRIYKNKFASVGYRVTSAVDGEQAIESIKQERPDVVLLDLMLPKVDGIEVLRFIRSRPESNTVPVIVFSNAYANTLIQDAWNAGATKCLTKVDCTPRQVIEVVHKALADSTAPVPAPPQPAEHAKVQPEVAAPAPVAPPPVVQEPPPPAPVPVPLIEPVPAVAAKDPAPVAEPAPQPPQPPAAPAPVAVEPERTPAQRIQAELDFQEELKQSFLKSAPEKLIGVRTLFQALVKADAAARQQPLLEMLAGVHSLTSNAAMAGFPRFAHMISALEALLKELHEKPRNINQSTIRTTALALNTLQSLLLAEAESHPLELAGSLVLVVDDEIISRRTVAQALQKTKLRPITVESPTDALKLAQENRFDLVFLDVDMPGMNGFELCTKLRTLPSNKTTPVVFVTNLNDFNSRTKSAQSGGNDLIGKPFLLIELAVKALTYLMQLPLEPTPNSAGK